MFDSFTPLQTYRLRQNEGLKYSITLVQNCTVWPTFLAALIFDSFTPLQTVQIILYLQAHTHLHYMIEETTIFFFLVFLFILKKKLTILFISKSFNVFYNYLKKKLRYFILNIANFIKYPVNR